MCLRVFTSGFLKKSPFYTGKRILSILAYHFTTHLTSHLLLFFTSHLTLFISLSLSLSLSNPHQPRTNQTYCDQTHINPSCRPWPTLNPPQQPIGVDQPNNTPNQTTQKPSTHKKPYWLRSKKPIQTTHRQIDVPNNTLKQPSKFELEILN